MTFNNISHCYLSLVVEYFILNKENKKRINLNTSLSNLFEFEQLSEKAVELIFNNVKILKL